MDRIHIDITVADATITKYNTVKPYVVGSDTLSVYRNGVITKSGKDYTEFDSMTIEFIDKLETGDKILITSSFINRDSKVDCPLFGNSPKAKFKKIDNKVHLLANQLYTIELNLGDQKFKYNFTSKYTPMFTSQTIIHKDLLDTIDNVSDDIINFTIWENSKLAIEIASMSSNTIDIKKDIPFYVKQWVRYRTELDLINTRYLTIVSNLGKEKKKLGNLEIERDKSVLPKLDDMLKDIKSKLDQFDKLLTGIKVVGKSTKKAGRTIYPLKDRRSF